MFSTTTFVFALVMQVVLTICAVYFSPRAERLETLGMVSLVAAGTWSFFMVVVVAYSSVTHATSWLPLIASLGAMASFTTAVLCWKAQKAQ